VKSRRRGKEIFKVQQKETPGKKQGNKMRQTRCTRIDQGSWVLHGQEWARLYLKALEKLQLYTSTREQTYKVDV